MEGFRFDAIKHMDENFCSGFVKVCSRGYLIVSLAQLNFGQILARSREAR